MLWDSDGCKWPQFDQPIKAFSNTPNSRIVARAQYKSQWSSFQLSCIALTIVTNYCSCPLQLVSRSLILSQNEKVILDGNASTMSVPVRSSEQRCLVRSEDSKLEFLVKRIMKSSGFLLDCGCDASLHTGKTEIEPVLKNGTMKFMTDHLKNTATLLLNCFSCFPISSDAVPHYLSFKIFREFH